MESVGRRPGISRRRRDQHSHPRRLPRLRPSRDRAFRSGRGADPRPPEAAGEGREGAAEETVDSGYVRDINGVDGGLLGRLLGIGVLPVVEPDLGRRGGDAAEHQRRRRRLGALGDVRRREADRAGRGTGTAGGCGGSGGPRSDARVRRHSHRDAPESPMHPQGTRGRGGPGACAAGRKAGQPAAGGLHPRGPAARWWSRTFRDWRRPNARCAAERREGTAGVHTGTAPRSGAKRVPPIAWKRGDGMDTQRRELGSSPMRPVSRRRI